MQAQSAYRTSNGNVTLRQGGYAIFNARLGYQIDEIWTAAVNVNNVFDRRYYSGLFSPQWNNRYGDPRNVMFTLKADFKLVSCLAVIGTLFSGIVLSMLIARFYPSADPLERLYGAIFLSVITQWGYWFITSAHQIGGKY